MRTLTEKQKKDISYFKNNLNEFLTDMLLVNKYVVISDEKIQNSFDTIENAVNYAVDNFKIGEYIIQQIIDESKIINSEYYVKLEYCLEWSKFNGNYFGLIKQQKTGISPVFY